MPKLTVHSNQDAQILVIDGDLNVVNRNVGVISTELKSGLYKVKVDRGGGTAEQLIDLTNDKELYLFVEAYPAIAPIGQLLGGHRLEIENLATQAGARSPSLKWRAAFNLSSLPNEPGLLIVGHQEIMQGNQSNPLRGLRVMTWRRVSFAATIHDEDTVCADIGSETWSAIWLPVEPGCHVIEIPDAEATCRQTVLVAPNWQTRVFLRRSFVKSPEASIPDKKSGSLPRIDISIQMARPGASVVYDDHLETVEVARNALERDRPIFVSEYLVESLLNEKFQNPIAGITGLHLFLEALERDQLTRDTEAIHPVFSITPALLDRSKDIVEEVISNLERLFSVDNARPSDLPSDIVALKARAGLLSNEGPVVVVEPPMFWASWDALCKSSRDDRGVLIGRQFWTSVAFSAPSGPYLSWRPRRTSFEAFIQSKIGSGRNYTIESLARDGAFKRIPFTLKSANLSSNYPGWPVLPADKELASALGIPVTVAGHLMHRK